MLSTLFSRQRSKLIPASPADLLAEDWFSFIGFPFCSVFRIYKEVAPFGGLLPLQSLVAFIRFSDRIGSASSVYLSARQGAGNPATGLKKPTPSRSVRQANQSLQILKRGCDMSI